MSFILSVIGVVLIIEGIPYFGFPGFMKNWGEILNEIPEKTLRIIGLASMITGLVLLYLANS